MQAHSPRRVVLRRGGRTRTRVAQFWRLPFWPLNYAPVRAERLVQLKTARQVVLGAVPSYPRHRVYLGTISPFPPSIGWQDENCSSRSMLAGQVYTAILP